MKVTIHKLKAELEEDYEKKVALIETSVLLSNKNLNYFSLKDYGYDLNLKKKHERFTNYINSTYERYVFHRFIITSHYIKKVYTVASISGNLECSRTTVSTLIKDGIEEDWITKSPNPDRQTEVQIRPTKLRIKFWKIFCKVRFKEDINIGLYEAHKKLKNYHENMKTYAALKSHKKQ